MGVKGKALNIFFSLSADKVRTLWLILLVDYRTGEHSSPLHLKQQFIDYKRKGGEQSPPLGKNKCWASPKRVSLSAESDQRLCLWKLRAFEKARSETFKCLIIVSLLIGSFISRGNRFLLLVSSEACRAIPRLGSGGSPPRAKLLIFLG